MDFGGFPRVTTMLAVFATCRSSIMIPTFILSISDISTLQNFSFAPYRAIRTGAILG